MDAEVGVGGVGDRVVDVDAPALGGVGDGDLVASVVVEVADRDLVVAVVLEPGVIHPQIGMRQPRRAAEQVRAVVMVRVGHVVDLDQDGLAAGARAQRGQVHGQAAVRALDPLQLDLVGDAVVVDVAGGEHG
ncbi:hypothetical protein HNR30_006829 [Nonomuraea soli]|uniref:Uncharacterized protein n=1 Tax=Nonomuraea soli TaxID=1032476 RepID=A0A7W0CQP1_9ACTN|nr:hypothetical protein [Nonomuraea soli]